MKDFYEEKLQDLLKSLEELSDFYEEEVLELKDRASYLTAPILLRIHTSLSKQSRAIITLCESVITIERLIEDQKED